MTVSDESLTLLEIDNSEFVWEAQASGHEITPSAKYTNKRAHRRVQEGWSHQGRLKFNNYFDMVKVNRDDDKRKTFELKFHSEKGGGSTT